MQHSAVYWGSFMQHSRPRVDITKLYPDHAPAFQCSRALLPPLPVLPLYSKPVTPSAKPIVQFHLVVYTYLSM